MPPWPLVPFQAARGSVSQWGDTYGNRVDRFTAASPTSTACGRASSWAAATTARKLQRPVAQRSRRLRLSRRPAHAALAVQGGLQHQRQHQQQLHRPRRSQPHHRRRRRRRQRRNHLRRRGRSTTTARASTPPASAMATRCTCPTWIRSRPGLEVFMRSRVARQLRRQWRRVPRCPHGRAPLRHPGEQRRRPRRGRRHRSEFAGLRNVGNDHRPQRRRALRLQRPGQQLYRTPSNMFYNFVVWWDADLTARTARRHDDLRVEQPGPVRISISIPATSGTQQCAQRLVEQRHQEHAGPLGRHPRRLARGSDLAPLRQHRARDLHDDNSRHVALSR